MCFVLTIVFIVAAFSFFSDGLILQAIISGVIASTALFFFIRKLIFNGRCIFGKDRDCNSK
jgi:hypothetical protein